MKRPPHSRQDSVVPSSSVRNLISCGGRTSPVCGNGVPLFIGFAVPCNSLCIVLRNTTAFQIHLAKIELCACFTSLGGATFVARGE